MSATNFADHPHNVWLGMLANGGLLLTLAYLVVTIVVGYLVLRGLMRLRGEQRILLGAVAGVWAAYHAQAFVSLDVPGLAIVHWISAAACVVLATDSGDRTLFHWRAPKRPTPAQRWGAGVTAGLILLAGGWMALRPLAAETAAGTGERYRHRNQLLLAEEQFSLAAARAPWEPLYVMEVGALRTEMGDLAGGLEAFQAALRADPRYFSAALIGARTAAAMGDREEATRLYERVLEIEPHHPSILIEAATHWHDQGEGELARRVIARILSLDPTHAAALELQDALESPRS